MADLPLILKISEIINMHDDEIIEKNKNYWNEHADLWYGTTALPAINNAFRSISGGITNKLRIIRE